MVETLFAWPSARAKQLKAPLLKEREQFLTHLLSQGVGIERVRVLASMLLHIVRIMELDQPRMVESSEIDRGVDIWSRDPDNHRNRKVGPESWQSFHYTARRWLGFHKMIRVAEPSFGPAELYRKDFILFMKVQREMCPQSIRTYDSRIKIFLEWALPRREIVSAISLHDVDDYLEMERRRGCLPRTIGSICVALRLFFRYGEMCGWSKAEFSRGIKAPRIARYDPLPKGLPWKHVRQLLDANVPQKPADLRATAMISLCSIYGLRSSEITNLTLNDFDWINETLVIRRVKRGRIQQYPIQYEVGESILRYLQFGRPRAECRNLFLTLLPPYRPVRPSSFWNIISRQIRRLGLNVKPVGPHSFRHACATELLRKGSSLTEIADFLGHRSLDSVSIYAKCDLRSLKKVATFSMAGVK